MMDLIIKNKFERKLAAYLFEPAPDSRYMMIVCHGFRGAKENGGKIFGFAEKIRSAGLGVLAFDFGGSGGSEGDFASISLSRQAEDLNDVLDWVSARYDLPVILLGRSFGGSTVLVGGSHDSRVAGYILWSTPVFMEQTFAAMLPEEYKLLEQGKTVRIKDEAGEFVLKPDLVADFRLHDMDACLQAVGSRPALVVHARDDETVDPANACHMQAQLKNCSLYMVNHAGHRFLDKIAEREAITLEWLKNNFI